MDTPSKKDVIEGIKKVDIPKMSRYTWNKDYYLELIETSDYCKRRTVVEFWLSSKQDKLRKRIIVVYGNLKKIEKEMERDNYFEIGMGYFIDTYNNVEKLQDELIYQCVDGIIFYIDAYASSTRNAVVRFHSKK
ncbi:hypothetical protein [[Clostridium] fimetarium]|uniref:Uncharacterized protein n=1 Tax=[Clostridium] fimetarium TaxID=99656 RepID=A0A1I0RDJ9_9FIRM|nr:hypothetical protein [[Clostridium] fimetarium]SEW38900.1 hypothetical protein SAMN05421659_11459 [[Clostridium] fimetarium]